MDGTKVNNDLSPTSPQRRWRKINRRETVWLVALAVFLLIVLIAWKPLRQELMLSVALRSDSPSDSVLLELANEANNRPQVLERMWRSGNLTTRLFVMDYVKTRVSSEAALVSQLDEIVKEAARDPDLSVRELALNVLAEDKHPESRMLLRQQLDDADPAVRVLALQQLLRGANSNDVPTAIRLLDDPDPRVVVSAVVVLRWTTGLDFGIRSSHAPPRFTSSEERSQVPPNFGAIRRGTEQWREWWQQHRDEFQEPAPLPPLVVPAFPAKEFALEDADGRTVHLSDFRGKRVLLCFWKSGSAARVDDLAVLKQLQQQQPEQLAVLIVAFAANVGPQDSCGEEHSGGHEHQHDHAHSAVASDNSAEPKSVIRNLVNQTGVAHTVLVDRTGSAVFRYNVQEVPTYALIDAQGNLRRRFTGSRELPVWTAMIQELSGR